MTPPAIISEYKEVGSQLGWFHQDMRIFLRREGAEADLKIEQYNDTDTVYVFQPDQLLACKCRVDTEALGGRTIIGIGSVVGWPHISWWPRWALLNRVRLYSIRVPVLEWRGPRLPVKYFIPKRAHK